MQLCFYHKGAYGYRIVCNRNNDILLLRDFLEDTIPMANEDYFLRLIDQSEGPIITDMMHIEKEKGMLYIRDLQEAIECWNTSLVLEIAGITALRLVREIEQIKNNYNRPANIIIMRENSQYFIKHTSLEALSFIRSSKGDYYLSNFWNENKLAALLKFLLTTPDFSFLISWLNSSYKEISVNCGHLTKNKNNITIHYHTSPAIMTHIISTQTLLKVVAEYQRLIALEPEELLLIHEPTYYSFMVNPFEEIKIPIGL